MLARVRTYASFIRFSHTVFALPFALTGALLAAQTVPLTWGRLGWIVAAMAMARTAAMGFNRLVDATFDAENPRTAGRELPRGIVTTREAVALVVVASVAFVGTAVMLGPLCFALSPVALAIVFWYSLAKRYTTYTQLFLGLALAVAPVGGWLAAGGRGGWAPWLLALGTATWVAGFDILYACEDIDFDRKRGLFSIPARFGVERALWISRGFHVVTIGSLASVALVMPLGQLYIAGVVGVAVLLVYEQSLVRPDDLSRVKQAFDLNGYVGLLYLTTTAAALYV
ncbi:MAG: UbiA-like polyprenyltransferase [Vicinamibacterales bacterium]